MLTMPAADFVRGVTSVLAAASGDRTLPVLNAVLVEWDAYGVTFAATDRYVCAEQVVPLPDDAREAGKALVPVEVVKSVLAVLKATAPKGNLADDRNVLVDDCEVYGQAFESPGDFPRYRSLFPAADAEGEIAAVVFDPALLAKLAGPKVKGRLPALRLKFTAPVKPVLVTRQDDEHFRGLLMPIRPTA